MFPPKYKMRKFQDENGVWARSQEITDGWMTRPWQQEVIEAPGLKKVIRVSRRAGKTAVAIIKALHTSFVQGRGVLVVAPMERQVIEIYSTMHKQFIDMKPEIFNDQTVKRDTRSPYVIQFSNGGFINFITAGTKSGGKGEAIRGQGHGVGLIYIDEADYLTDADLDAILAIQIQDPSMEVILTSTPTGKRNKFYQFCTDPPRGWRAFHKTCYEAIPNFSLEMEESLKKQYGHDAFAREFLAEFGEEATGVFDKTSIDQALKRGDDIFPFIDDYGQKTPIKYPHFGYAKTAKIDPTVHRFVGVDWDKYGAGTQLLVIEARKAAINKNSAYEVALESPFDYITVIHRKEIPKSKFTLSVAVNTLLEINRDFNPDFYYLDAGYGEHQIEQLILLGLNCKDPNDPAYGIHKKINRINFSTHVEIIDPASKKMVKKPIKPEMVGRLVNKFDTGEMVLSPYDDVLKAQLENYVVEKITAQGVPRYTSVNEHAVDALMLAVWGLYEQFGKAHIATQNKAYIEKPIGERYLQLQAQLRTQRQVSARPDYFDDIQDDVTMANIDEDAKLARDGMLRPDAVRTTKGLPNGGSATSSASTFQRGGMMPSRRRSF
jgi:replicative DNA helicase